MNVMDNITMVTFYQPTDDAVSTSYTQVVLNVTHNGNGSCVNDSAPDDGVTISLVSDIMGIWVTGVFCLLGFAGNVASFLVLMRAFSRSPMFLVLRAVAGSDAIFLSSVLLLSTIVNLDQYIDFMDWWSQHRGYIQFGAWPIMMMAQMLTVWLTVLVSAERYIAICYPLKAAAQCTIPKVRRAVLIISTVSILYNIPRYFEYKVVHLEEVGITAIDKTYIGTTSVYRYLYNCALYSLMLFLIPLLLLVFLNAKLVLALRQGKKQWQSLQCRQKKEQNLTIIPLTIVLVFFVCGTPALIVNIMESLNPYMFESQANITFMVVANFLVVLNSACNFVIYCLLGKKFRHKLLELCGCRRRWGLSSGSNYRVVHQLVNSQVSDL